MATNSNGACSTITYTLYQDDGTTAYTGSDIYLDGSGIKTKTNSYYAEKLKVNVNNNGYQT